MVRKQDKIRVRTQDKTQTRVCFLVTAEERDAMRQEAERAGETLSDYWRRAVRLQRFVDKHRKKRDTTLYVRNAKGVLKEIVML